MKTASSGRNHTPFLPRLVIVAITGALSVILFGVAAPQLRAETPPDQIKAAGAIALTTDLLDSMDNFIKNASADAAAKAELSAIGKDPSMTPENWGATISAKCPKAVEVFKASGITPDDFAKAIFAIMAVSMAEDMAKSDDETVAENAAFVTANKDRCDATFGSFMMLGEPGPGTSPAANP